MENNHGDMPIVPTIFRQIGENESRIATPRDLADTMNQHLLIHAPGLTLRQYYAGLAMQGLLANNWTGYAEKDPECDMLATIAVNFADALLSALDKKEGSHE